MRLVGGSDNLQLGTREGRVEICINDAWGTVCDTLHDTEDAGVVCEQLEGFQRDGESHESFSMCKSLESLASMPSFT